MSGEIRDRWMWTAHLETGVKSDGRMKSVKKKSRQEDRRPSESGKIQPRWTLLAKGHK